MLSISFDHSDFHCSSVKFVILYSDIAVLARNSMFRSRCCFLFPLMVVDVDFFEFMIWDCFHDRLHTNRCNIPSIFFFFKIDFFFPIALWSLLMIFILDWMIAMCLSGHIQHQCPLVLSLKNWRTILPVILHKIFKTCLV